MSKKKVKIFQIFVVFSEYMNFIYHKTHMQFGTL